ncbi:S41 family peptidase [Rubrivivax rivuli]|uniref:Tricorn protease homolog n=1 Tax=Rubrivivax rivuli TaxID=1862385 RepID=A0A437R916_9BURK|nr:S41 family peptidase [Rubrivivax rivuli]RVU43286.1 peptidase S41 [Rubrivivax rivuli]
MHSLLTRCLAAALLGAAVAGPTAALAQTATQSATPTGEREGFYRFPTLRGQTIVFTADSDLWRVGLQGGRAERITTHPELEARAALSPDGRTLAFVGAYEGVAEVYTLPLAGGVPQRLTWQGQNPRVWGHTPAGEVLVTAPAQRGEPVTQLYAIDPRTQAQRVLPVGQASDGALSADGHILYFTRLGLLSDNVRAYRGGGMAQLWRLDLRGQAEAQPLLPVPAAGARPAGNDQRPMPYRGSLGERIAFLSDRDGQFNLYSVNAQGGDLQQHTRHRGWDIRHASIDGTRVVYALGADLRLVDLETGQDQRLAITLGGDADALRARWVQRPQGFFDGARVSPDGQRALLNVRGRLATQGTGTLRRAELPVPADARCRDGVFGHDGRHVYALCDIAPAPVAAGAPPAELEVWRFNADGSGAPLQITRGATMRRLAIFPSPDGRWLAHTDKNGKLSLTALTPNGPGATRAVELPGAARNAPAQLVWAPDSQSFVFTRGGADANRGRLFLHHVAQARTVALTSDRYSSSAPAFTPDGRWLYFLSDRHFASLNAGPWGDRNLGPYFDRRSKIYALALQASGPRFPFQPRDELQAEGEASAAPAPAAAAASAAGTAPARTGGAAGAARSAAVAPLELEGLAQRLHEVPLPPGNYTRLHTDGRRLYFLEADSTVERRTSLRTLAIENTGPQPELFAADVNDYELSGDAKRLLLVRRAASPQQAADIQLMDAAAKPPTEPAVLARTQVRWADWQIQTEPAAEWRQLFDDAWRLHRDHFYDAKMHGTDWPAVRRKYAALLPRVGERRELAELMAQMVAEVGALHSQVAAGDVRRGPDDIAAAGLGARFSKVAQGFRVEQLFRSDPELPTEAGPLVQAGVKVGEIITTLNGRSLAGVAALPELLRGQVGRQVLLTVKPEVASGSAGAERRVVVLPINAEREAALREGDWEHGRLQRAAERSQGRVGYLRLRAMGRGDMATFAREFYAQLDREALIIDVRNNNGGNIDSWVLTQLLRRAWAWWQPRSPEGAETYSNMQQAYRGRIAVLIDADTYSDGETFAEGFKRLQLGTLIGRRTAGAGIWLSDGNRLLDRGIMRAAETGQYALDGGWLIEGRGVTPDIDVDNPPRATHEGGDAQLDAAVNHLLRQLAEQPLPRPVAPPHQRP